MRETQVERDVVRRVKEAGGIAYKLISPQRNGVPDRLVILPGGRLYFVETKAPGERLRPEQQREHAALRALGATVLVIDQVGAPLPGIDE